MTTYPMTASACFAIAETTRTITIEGVTFDWDTEAGDRDQQAILAALESLPNRFGAPLIPIWVETSPIKYP